MAEESNGARPFVRVARIAGKGRGVVADRRLAEGDVIDRAPVIVIPASDWPLIQETVVSRFCFCWRDGADDTAVALGIGSLMNHSYSPNAFSQRRIRERVMEFIALRDIEEGEEITLNYNGDPEGRDPVGFTVRDP